MLEVLYSSSRLFWKRAEDLAQGLVTVAIPSTTETIKGRGYSYPSSNAPIGAAEASLFWTMRLAFENDFASIEGVPAGACDNRDLHHIVCNAPYFFFPAWIEVEGRKLKTPFESLPNTRRGASWAAVLKQLWSNSFCIDLGPSLWRQGVSRDRLLSLCLDPVYFKTTEGTFLSRMLLDLSDRYLERLGPKIKEASRTNARRKPKRFSQMSSMERLVYLDRGLTTFCQMALPSFMAELPKYHFTKTPKGYCLAAELDCSTPGVLTGNTPLRVVRSRLDGAKPHQHLPVPGVPMVVKVISYEHLIPRGSKNKTELLYVRAILTPTPRFKKKVKEAYEYSKLIGKPNWLSIEWDPAPLVADPRVFFAHNYSYYNQPTGWSVERMYRQGVGSADTSGMLETFRYAVYACLVDGADDSSKKRLLYYLKQAMLRTALHIPGYTKPYWDGRDASAFYGYLLRMSASRLANTLMEIAEHFSPSSEHCTAGAIRTAKTIKDLLRKPEWTPTIAKRAEIAREFLNRIATSRFRVITEIDEDATTARTFTL